MVEHLEYIILFGGGIIIGIIGVILGGAVFLAIPFFQTLFPSLNYSQTIGNIKVGSFTRGIASTISTWKQISFKESITFIVPFVAGSIIGAISITNLNQKYLFLAVILAIVLSEISPKIAKYINKKTRLIASILLGIYTGLIGAGISILLVALLRTLFPKDEDIVYVKIQARFVETTATIAAIITHVYYGQIIFPLWIAWATGSFIGGLLGGTILKKSIHINPRHQRKYLYGVYAVTLLPFIIRLF